MRIHDDLRKSVVFFGYSDTAKASKIACVGTGFLMSYRETPYLVTVKHLSLQLGRDPFLIRINNKSGAAENLHVDDVLWFEHSDPLVDLAIVNLHIGIDEEYDVMYVDGDAMLATTDIIADEAIGIGNFTYTLGLFRLLTGEKRNLPICHTGNIALLPGDELIPVIDWTDANPVASKRRRVNVEAYLVEAQSMGGLSGSPVFVRPEITVKLPSSFKFQGGAALPPAFNAGRDNLRLIGVWQGAWEASPDEVRAAQSNANVVPVGMGVVVPSSKIIELMERDDVIKVREEYLAMRATRRSATGD